MSAVADYPIISADSHITEPPGTYVDHIESKYRDSASRMVRDEEAADLCGVDLVTLAS